MHTRNVIRMDWINIVYLPGGLPLVGVPLLTDRGQAVAHLVLGRLNATPRYLSNHFLSQGVDPDSLDPIF